MPIKAILHPILNSDGGGEGLGGGFSCYQTIPGYHLSVL